MAENLFTELLKGIGGFFLNPLVYWAVLLVIITGYKRIKDERCFFGFKIFDVFSEARGTWKVSLLFGLVISILTMGIGLVLSRETILLIAVVTIVLSLTFRLTLLSPVYTIGIPFLLLLMIPPVWTSELSLDSNLFDLTHFTALSLLLAFLLAVEAFLLQRQTKRDTFPALEQSKRGSWIGLHHLKKMALIPFFVLVPHGSIPSIVSFWPYFSLNGETYSLVLVPFLLGFHHVVRSELPDKSAASLAKSTYLLSFIVFIFAIGSIYISSLSIIAVVAGIIGREFVNYKQRSKKIKQAPFFHGYHNGVQVLAVIPGTPAERLGVIPGELITKVNNTPVDSIDSFYYALQDSGAFFRLTVIGENGEVHFVQSALYERDHHQLGIVTVDQPYHDFKKAE